MYLLAQKASFNKYLKQVIPHFTEWTIDTDNQNDYVKYKTATAEHHANLSGDGIISDPARLFIADHIHRITPTRSRQIALGASDLAPIL